MYQIAESNRIEKIDSIARIESNRMETFCPNWNALVDSGAVHWRRLEVLYSHTALV